MRRFVLSGLAALAFSGFAAAPAAGAFDPIRDTFAFANETVFAYDFDERGSMRMQAKEEPPAYAHRCFVMTRAVLQFHQFAQFDPSRPRVSRRDYAKIIRRISRVPVWSHGPRERIVVPGFRDLHEFSKFEPSVLQENLGNWLPTYLRVGNWRMGMGHPRAGQSAAARWLLASIEAGHPRAVYLARFPHLNHCVVVYAADRQRNGDIHFTVHDPNYAKGTTRLDYIAAESSFNFSKRWYFNGGRVNVMRIYISPFH